jgi:hypothetical protein
MQRSTKLGLAVAAVCMFAVTPAAASAQTVELPEFSAETSFTSTSGTVTLALSGAEIACASATGEGAATSKKKGTIKADLKECKLSGKECHSTGDKAGIILLSGEYQLAGGVNEVPEALTLLSISEVHIECLFLSSTARIRGSVLGQITPTDTSTKTYEIKLRAPEGKQELTEYETESGEAVQPKLEGSVNSGSFKAMTASFNETKLTTGAAVELKASPPLPPLEKIQFTNSNEIVIDHQHNAVPEKAITITEYGAKNSFQWEKAGANIKNWPIMYKQGARIKLEARLSVGNATRAFLLGMIEGQTRIYGESTVNGVALLFSAEFSPAEVKSQLEAHNMYLSTNVVTAGNALSARVGYEEMKIAWRWEVKEVGRANPYRQRLGESKHNLYVVRAEPRTTAAPYLTLLDVDSLGIAKESPSEAQVVAGAWKGFEAATGPAMHLRTYEVATGTIARNGKTLEYWAEVMPGKTLNEQEMPECTATTILELLEKGKGQCGAWALAFGSALAIEGVGSKFLEVKPTVGGFFLVKNWEFAADAGTSGNAEFPYLPEEITDRLGIAGQGDPNPPGAFKNHYIEEVHVEAGPEELYDPSYGTGPYKGANPLKELQEASIAGFCELKSFDCQKTPAALQLKIEPLGTF